MTHDPARVADTKGWVRKAREDLAIAKELVKGSKSFAGGTVFHCQQAAEKAFKAFLVWHDKPFRKTHELEEIGEACIKLDATLKETVDQAVPLTEYAWKFRYPGEPELPSKKEAKEALAVATEVFNQVLKRFPKEVRR
jgi:HEPN domain-containing protein